MLTLIQAHPLWVGVFIGMIFGGCIAIIGLSCLIIGRDDSNVKSYNKNDAVEK